MLWHQIRRPNYYRKTRNFAYRYRAESPGNRRPCAGLEIELGEVAQRPPEVKLDLRELHVEVFTRRFFAVAVDGVGEGSTVPPA